MVKRGSLQALSVEADLQAEIAVEEETEGDRRRQSEVCQLADAESYAVVLARRELFVEGKIKTVGLAGFCLKIGYGKPLSASFADDSDVNNAALLKGKVAGESV